MKHTLQLTLHHTATQDWFTFMMTTFPSVVVPSLYYNDNQLEEEHLGHVSGDFLLLGAIAARQVNLYIYVFKVYKYVYVYIHIYVSYILIPSLYYYGNQLEEEHIGHVSNDFFSLLLDAIAARQVYINIYIYICIYVYVCVCLCAGVYVYVVCVYM